MTYGQYRCLNVHAADSNRSVIRKALTMLSGARLSREHRGDRHAWLREILYHHARDHECARCNAVAVGGR